MAVDKWKITHYFSGPLTADDSTIFGIPLGTADDHVLDPEAHPPQELLVLDGKVPSLSTVLLCGDTPTTCRDSFCESFTTRGRIGDVATPLSTIQLFESATQPSLDEMELFALEITAGCDVGESRLGVR